MMDTGREKESGVKGMIGRMKEKVGGAKEMIGRMKGKVGGAKGMMDMGRGVVGVAWRRGHKKWRSMAELDTMIEI